MNSPRTFIALLVFIACHNSSLASYQYREADQLIQTYELQVSTEFREVFLGYAKAFSSTIFSNPDSAFLVAENGLQNENLSADIQLVFKLWKIKSLSAQSKYGAALTLLKEIDIASIENSRLRGDFQILQGRLYKYNRKYLQALSMYKEAEATFQNVGDQMGLAILYVNLGEYYRSLASFNDALSYLKDSKVLIDTYNLPSILALYYLNRIAAVYNESGQLELALEATQETLEQAELTNNKFLMATCFNEMASIQHKLGHSENTEKLLRKAITLWKETGHDRYWVNASGNLISFLIKQGKWNEIEPLLNDGVPIAKKNDWHSILYTYYGQLSWLYLKQNKTVLAYHYLDSSQNFLRLDLEASINKELSVQKANFELEKKQLELDLSKAESRRTNRERNLAFYGIGAMFVLIGVLARLVFMVVSRNKRIHQANEQLNEALKAKEALLKDMHHRVKNNLAFLISLVHLQKSQASNPEMISEYDEIKHRLEAMAMLHSNLLKTHESEDVDINELIEQIRNQVVEITGTDHVIELDLEKRPVILNADKAIVLGVVVNELFTNALKHAFTDKENGNLKLTFRKEDDQAILDIVDDGKGMPEDLDLDAPKTVGLKLITLLMDQLKGSITYSKEINLIKLKFGI